MNEEFDNCKHSCIRQLSCADSDFFNLDKQEELDGYEDSQSVTDDNILCQIPKVESFILQENQDSFYLKFMRDSEDQLESIESNICASEKKRVKRWLKNQDRKMIEIIL